MKRTKFSSRATILTAILAAILAASCSLDIPNPNGATQEEVEGTGQGVMGLAIGIQQYYSTVTLQYRVLTPGLSSKEVAVNRTFSGLLELESGGAAVNDQNANLLNLWGACLKVVSMAQELEASTPGAPLVAGTKSGLLAVAYVFKAMALGALAESFEQAPIAASTTSPPQFHPRAEVLAEALRLLALADQTITATAPSAEFNSRVLDTGLDLKNTISAYEARYHLMLGHYAEAIAAANTASPTAKSSFAYDDKGRNPIYDALTSLGRWAPIDKFGMTALDTTDQRLAFYLTPSSALSNPSKIPIDVLKGFFDAVNKPIPVYLPGELRLIRAEAFVRLGNLPAALAEINAIRTKTPAQDPFGVGAALPPYSGAVTADALLDEIYRERCAEMFWSGLRLEDSRRLGRPGPLSTTPERTRDYYPYPAQERVNNPNTPANPAI